MRHQLLLDHDHLISEATLTVLVTQLDIFKSLTAYLDVVSTSLLLVHVDHALCVDDRVVVLEVALFNLVKRLRNCLECFSDTNRYVAPFMQF